MLEKNLLDREILQAGVNWDKMSDKLLSLWIMLHGFETVETCIRPSRGDLEGCFQAPMQWFAQILLRTGTDLTAIFEFLKTSQVLGRYEYRKSDDTAGKMRWLTSRVAHVPAGSTPIGYKQSLLPAWGLWLPRVLRNAKEEKAEFRR